MAHSPQCRFGALLAVGLVTAVLAGCGGANGDSSAPSRSGVEDLDLIHRGTITAATVAGSPPFSGVGQDGKPAGLLIEVNETIAKRMGLKIVYRTISESGAFAGITTNQFDMLSIGLVEDPQQAHAVAFTKPIYWGVNATLVPVSATESKPADFAGKRVGGSGQSAQFLYAQQTFKTATVDSEASNASGLSQLLDGNIDGFVVGGTQAGVILAQHPGKLKIAMTTPQARPSAMAINKNEPKFQKAYAKQFANLVNDGTFLKLFYKYLPTTPYPTDMYRFWPSLEQQQKKLGKPGN